MPTERLDIASAPNAFARLGIVANGIIEVNVMLRFEVSGSGCRPVPVEDRAYLHLARCHHRSFPLSLPAHWPTRRPAASASHHAPSAWRLGDLSNAHAPSPRRNCTSSARAQNAGYSQPPSLFVNSHPLLACTVTIVPTMIGNRSNAANRA